MDIARFGHLDVSGMVPAVCSCGEVKVIQSPAGPPAPRTPDALIATRQTESASSNTPIFSRRPAGRCPASAARLGWNASGRTEFVPPFGQTTAFMFEIAIPLDRDSNFRVKSITPVGQDDTFNIKRVVRLGQNGTFKTASITLVGRGDTFKTERAIRLGKSETFRPIKAAKTDKNIGFHPILKQTYHPRD